MSWFNNWIDKHFEKQGYKIKSCDKYGACYEKYVKEYDYTSVIHIAQKNSGRHIVQCYDAQVLSAKTENSSKTKFVNQVDGLYASLLFWAWLKYKWLSHKYNWKRMQNYYD